VVGDPFELRNRENDSDDQESPVRSIGMRRTLAVCAVLTLLGAAATTILAAPASASTSTPLPLPLGPTVTYESERTAYDDENPKHITASCHDGKKLIGVGYSRSGGAAGVVIDRAVPVVNQTGREDWVTVYAYETAAGTPNRWSLEARAICASGLSNVVLSDDTSDIDGEDSHTAVAECPFGTKVVGTSFAAISEADDQGDVMVTEVNPIASSGGNDTVRVSAHADADGTADDWGVKAYAFCATAPLGLTIVSRTQNPPTDRIDQAVACPDGKVGLGAGAYFNDFTGAAAENLMLTNLNVSGPYTQFNGEYLAVASAMEDAAGTQGADWELTVKLVCATA
jgi:hypothetical protein